MKSLDYNLPSKAPVFVAFTKEAKKESRLSWGNHLKYEQLESWLSKLFVASDIDDSAYFTLHCFRRGGAQHRYIFHEKYGHERWDIAMLRVWAGWTDSDDFDVLIKYILEETYRHENDMSNMLFKNFKRGMSKTKTIIEEQNSAIKLLKELQAATASVLEMTKIGELSEIIGSVKELAAELCMRFIIILALLSSNTNKSKANDDAMENVMDIDLNSLPNLGYNNYKEAVRMYLVGEPLKKITNPLRKWTNEEINSCNH
jgi:hypothetical protein